MPADLSLHTIHLSIQTGDVQQWIRWNYSSAVVSLLAGQCTPTIRSQPHMPTSTRMAIRFPPLSKITLQQVNRFVKLAIFELTKYCSFIADKPFYHMSNSHECMGVNGEALQLRKVYKKPHFLLQVTWESVRCYKSDALRLNVQWIEGLYDRNHYHYSTLVYWRWHCYSCCTLVTIQTATN